MRRKLRGTGHDSTLWPVLLLLLIVLVPSAGVVWMMRAAMDNERLAVRQRLADAYHTQLQIAQGRINDEWQSFIAHLDTAAVEHPPRRAFSQCVLDGAADSVVILDAEGHIAYPSTPATDPAADEKPHPAWNRAQRLEFAENNPLQAAE